LCLVGPSPRTPRSAHLLEATAGESGVASKIGVNDPFGSSVSACESGSRPRRRGSPDLPSNPAAAAVFCRTPPCGRSDVILGTSGSPGDRRVTCDRTVARDGVAMTVTVGGHPGSSRRGDVPDRSTVDIPRSAVSTVDPRRPRWAVRPCLVHPGAGIALFATERSFHGDTPIHASSSSCYLPAIFWRGSHAACGWKSL